MRKILIILVTLGLFVSSSQLASATQNRNVVSKFMIALVKRDEKLAKSYVDSDVKIPEIRENTPFRGFTGLPSSKQDVRVVIAYFEDDLSGERIAFIWEVTANNEKIKDIRVVYDGSNPLMNEQITVKEYEAKFHKQVLVPSHFPFEITHVHGDIYEDELILRYRNVDIKGLVQIKVAPKTHELEMFKRKNDTLYTLKNGAKALYQRDVPAAYQLIFQQDGLQYYVGIGKHIKKKFTVDDVIKIVESML